MEAIAMDSRLLWGAVEMLILEAIGEAPTYGYQIAQTVMNRSTRFSAGVSGVLGGARVSA